MDSQKLLRLLVNRADDLIDAVRLYNSADGGTKEQRERLNEAAESLEALIQISGIVPNN